MGSRVGQRLEIVLKAKIVGRGTVSSCSRLTHVDGQGDGGREEAPNGGNDQAAGARCQATDWTECSDERIDHDGVFSSHAYTR